MKSGHVLVFDVGGTHLRCGLYDPEQDLISRSTRVPTPSYLRHPELPKRLLRARLYETMEQISVQIGMQDPAVISVAFAGPVDERGTVLKAPTIWGSGETFVPVADHLGEIWPSAHILVANDLSAAGYCFLRDVADDFCVVTVSSGIGHKVFIGGTPVVGPSGYGGEIGHVRVDFSDDAPRCDCGGFGHLGALASGRATQYQAARLIEDDPHAFADSALGRSVSRQPGELDNVKISSAFRSGDEWAARLVRAIATPLGRALAGIHLTVGVERFILMGGFSAALGHGYLELVAEAASQADWHDGKNWQQMLELRNAGDEAGLLGAGRMANRNLSMSSENSYPESDA